MSTAVTVTEQAHAVVGIPVTCPVDTLMARPAGRPDTDHVEMVAVDELSEAALTRAEMAEPDTLVWVPGLVTVTTLVTFQVKVADPDPWGVALSLAVIVTEQTHAVVGVPVTCPVDTLITRPNGNPEAVQVEIVAVVDESPATLLRAVMADPDTLLFVPGLVTVIVLVMFQVNEAVAVSAWVSVAVMVTEQAQAVVGVPVMAPVPEAMERPAGRPDAEKVTALPPVTSWGATMVRVEMAVPEVLACVPGLVTLRTSTFQVRVTDPAVPFAAFPPPALPTP